MKEGTGGDNLSIGVRYPDGTTESPILNNLYLIPGLNFMFIIIIIIIIIIVNDCLIW